MTIKKIFILDKCLQDLPVQFCRIEMEKQSKTDAIKRRGDSSKKYKVRLLDFYTPYKPISRLLRYTNENH